jgi:aminotransferase
VRHRPARIDGLPTQYFVGLLGRVAEAAASDGVPVIDLGRGNPEVGPPAHVVERLAEAARDPGAHGYAPFRGLPALKEAIAARYHDVYGVEIDPEREVAVVPGTKSLLAELQLVLAQAGSVVVLPDPGYPDYASGAVLSDAELATLPLDPQAEWMPAFASAPERDVAAVYLNFPSNPCAAAVRPGVFAEAVRYAERTGAVIVHDFAYGDLVFDGRPPESFLATEGAGAVGVELFSMSKTYGMAGWRLGFVIGNAEVVARVELLQDHVRAGIFMPIQEAGIAALTGPQDTVAERVGRYQERRDRVTATLERAGVSTAVSEGTFYVWAKLPAELTPERLLSEHRIAVAPGEGFGSGGAGWVRFSVAVADAALDEGLGRLAQALQT